MYVILLDIAKFPSVRVVPLCTPTSDMGDYLLLPGLANRVYCQTFGLFANLIGEKIYLV